MFYGDDMISLEGIGDVPWCKHIQAFFYIVVTVFPPAKRNYISTPKREWEHRLIRTCSYDKGQSIPGWMDGVRYGGGKTGQEHWDLWGV